MAQIECVAGPSASPFQGVSLTAALAMWKNWTVDIAPMGSIGDRAGDKRLADAFRELAKLPDTDARFRWLEHAVWSADDFPNPARPADRVRAVLIGWWLELYDAVWPDASSPACRS